MVGYDVRDLSTGLGMSPASMQPVFSFYEPWTKYMVRVYRYPVEYHGRKSHLVSVRCVERVVFMHHTRVNFFDLPANEYRQWMLMEPDYWRRYKLMLFKWVWGFLKADYNADPKLPGMEFKKYVMFMLARALATQPEGSVGARNVRDRIKYVSDWAY